MIEFIKAGGWVMWPLLVFSVITVAIVFERLWVLRPSKIAPPGLLDEVWNLVRTEELDADRLAGLRDDSPLGRILVSGLVNARHGRDIMKEAIVDTAGHEVHEMQRFLNLLGSIAMISPLLGLLGTVLGMVEMFNALVLAGNGNTALLAAGIGKALYTTVAGLMVAIPATFFHRFFGRRIDEIVVVMEQDAIRLVDVFHGDREDESLQAGV
jgi:biopolymer transport protein ExbB